MCIKFERWIINFSPKILLFLVYLMFSKVCKMELQALTAISPIDGRYRNQVASLAPYLSEFGLIHYRVRIEIEYFSA